MNNLPDGYRTTKNFVLVLNTESESVPSFGAMEVIGKDMEGVYSVRKPTKDNANRLILINHDAPIQSDKKGQACNIFPCQAAFDRNNQGATDPVVGQMWGVAAGSWYLNKNRTGFIVAETPLDLVSFASNIFVDLMPHNLDELVKITSTTKYHGRYPGKRIFFNAIENSKTELEDIWIVDPNDTGTMSGSSTGLISTGYYLAQLKGFADDRPVYVIGAAALSSSGSGSGSNGINTDAGCCSGTWEWSCPEDGNPGTITRVS